MKFSAVMKIVNHRGTETLRKKEVLMTRDNNALSFVADVISRCPCVSVV